MSVKLTIDESKAEPRQSVFFQISFSVLSVPLMLNFPPAQHSLNEHQIVAVGGPAQSLFRLDIQDADIISTCFCSNYMDQQVGC